MLREISMLRTIPLDEQHNQMIKMPSIKVLHISNDFRGTKVHRNLFIGLDQMGVKQIVFSPLKTLKNLQRNSVDFKESESEIISSDLLKKYHKIFFNAKINY